jgi:hypothetical protein
MSARDIMPLNCAEWEIMHFPLDAGATFVEGEPVALNDAGEVQEAGDDPTNGGFIGFAASSGDTAGATGTIGTFRDGGTLGDFNPTSNLPQTADLIPVWVPKTNGARVVTRRFSSVGAAFGDVTPTRGHVGDEVGLSLISGVWGFDISTTNNVGRIVELWDANQIPIELSGKPAVFIVVAITSHEMNSVTAPVAD